jgi:hypothetical protein
MNNEHVHPIFQEILRSFELQPTMLHRAAVKAEPRRFSAEPVEPSAFAGLDGIGQVGSERWLSVRDEEQACQRADARRDEMGEGDE